MSWRPGKWASIQMRVGDLEVVEAPLYRSAGGWLFKTLYSYACRMDCLYCPLRAGCRVERRVWRVEGLVRTALILYRRGVVRGVFISSGLFGDPEVVSEKVVEVAEALRRAGYRGYIHIRLMPGTPTHLIRRALAVADRVGINLETVDASRFSEVAPSKGSWSLDILSKLLYAARVAPRRDAVSTQVVVGVAGESDEEHLRLMAVLAEGGVGRMYFSPYTPIPGTPLASKRPATPPSRALRLHQAWILISSYGFKPEDFEPILDERGMLPETSNLKKVLAEAHPEWFPVNIWEAKLEELLRVPGIGLKTAKTIIELREKGQLTVDKLRSLLGPRWAKAARYLDL